MVSDLLDLKDPCVCATFVNFRPASKVSLSLHIEHLRALICDFGHLSVILCSDVSVLPLQLQSDLDQEYQDKFRRLPVEIQEFVQDSSKAKLSEDCLYGKLPASSTTERLNHKTSQSEDEMEEGSTERVYDTAL